jgi:hypothetical protein
LYILYLYIHRYSNHVFYPVRLQPLAWVLPSPARNAKIFFLKTESYTYIKRGERLYSVAFNFVYRNLEYIRMVFCFISFVSLLFLNYYRYFLTFKNEIGSIAILCPEHM